MKRGDRRLLRHLEAQLRDRRPGPLDEAADLEAVRIAAALAAERPGAAEPAPRFVEDLARRLRAEVAGDSPVPSPDRRRFLAAATATAAAAAVGAGAGIGLDRLRGSSVLPPPRARLRPDDGVWVAVAAASDLAPTAVRRFSANGVEGYLVSTAGVVSAVSAICTDQGCVLRDDPAAGRFVCPCHGATFARDGTPTQPTSSYAVTSLPEIPVRVGEQVEVLVPRAPQ
ncbi:MAG: QcrA and Rieske domain-containing protein [Candidatus Dormibacteria bacterium]